MESNTAHIVLGNINDLPQIYEDMQTQFPPEEMYKQRVLVQLLNNNKYKILLYRRDSDDALIAYALVYTIEDTNVLWLDYLAVLDQYKGRGCGSALFRAIMQKYCGPFDGMLFSVEHVCRHDPALAERQRRRLNFYQRLGARRLQAGFLLPTNDGGLPMYLYYMPRHGITTISRSVQIQAITQMYDYCFFYLKHRKELLPQYKNSIIDEVVLPQEEYKIN